jgi:hypothetical protein
MGARAAWRPAPGAFSAVMATGALSVAMRARLPILSAVLLWLGVVELGAIVIVIALGRRREALDALTLAAASGVLAVRFAIGGDRAGRRRPRACGCGGVRLCGRTDRIVRAAPVRQPKGRVGGLAPDGGGDAVAGGLHRDRRARGLEPIPGGGR